MKELEQEPSSAQSTENRAGVEQGKGEEETGEEEKERKNRRGGIETKEEMNEPILGGDEQPGEPSLFRGDRRTETDLGGEFAVQMEEVDEVDGTKQLCLWPKERFSIRSCWAKIRETLGAEDVAWVRKIVEVRQTQEQVRFDLWVDSARGIEVLERLRRAKHDHRWWVREHVHYFRRLRLGMMGNMPRQVADDITERIRVATWNIHSVGSKRQELELYLQTSGVKLLGLQETYRGIGDWPLFLRDYQVFESIAEGGRFQGLPGGRLGQNGLALVIHRSLVAHEIGDPSPYLVGVKIMMGTTEWVVLNVYLPPKGYVGRVAAIQALRRAVRTVYARDLGARLLVMGDWNVKEEGLQQLLRRWRHPLSLLPCVGNPASFQGHRRWTAIDHFVVSQEWRGLVSKARVNRSWDLSDHWPVECTIQAVSREQDAAAGVLPQDGIRLDVSACLEKKEDILSHTIWDSLLDLEDVEVSDLPVLLETAIAVVASDTAVERETQGEGLHRKPTYRLSKGAKWAIHRRRKAHREWAAIEGPARGGPKWHRYMDLKQVAQNLKRRSAQCSWIRHIAVGATKVCENDLGGFWRWANQIMHRGSQGSSDFGPVYSEDETLVYDTGGKLQVWRRYYDRLLTDQTGHSRDAEYWRGLFPGPAAAELPGLNDQISWPELNQALGKLKAGKAPGRDGVPPEFYKLAFEKDDEALFADEPQSAFGQVILFIARELWASGSIPDKWNEAWLVSILKKGDPKRLTNYRGISLLVVIVKLVTIVISTRISEALEDRGWFIPQQAGFRTREECLGHVCALYEILTRREIQGKRTYVAFIDFEKAYDTVPIEGMLRKLYLAGVTGQCLAFVRGLYANATVRVRTKSGLSEFIRLLRGLRQGCNASPLLFDVFINDILRGCEQLGVQVVGVDGNGRVVGLLFADDLVLICSNRRRLRQALELVQSWADVNEMRFGVGKCGVMGFGAGATERLQRNPDQFRLGDERVPLVDVYVYLGLPFTSPLSLPRMAASRAEKGQRALNAVQGALSCVSIPIALRVKIVKAIIVPVLTYGGELWGMQEERSLAPQRVLSQALRLLVRLGSKNSQVSAAALGLEFDIPPVYASVCAARARGYRKYGELRTTVSTLVRSPVALPRRTWVTSTRWWIRRFCPEGLEGNIADGTKRVKQTVWERMLLRRSSGVTVTRYREQNMADSRSYIWLGVRYPQLARGFHWLTRLRLGSFWTARRFARIGWLAAEFMTRCPFCRQVGTGETVHHLLIECECWDEPRQLYLAEWIALGATETNLLGGSGEAGDLPLDGGRLRWCPRDPTFHPEAELLEGAPTQEEEERTPGCVQVARYLQHIIPIRLGMLRPVLEAPRADAGGGGMAVLAEDGDGVVVNDEDSLTATSDSDSVDTRRGVAVPGLR